MEGVVIYIDKKKVAVCTNAENGKWLTVDLKMTTGNSIRLQLENNYPSVMQFNGIKIYGFEPE
jgi:hypothetical protein